MSVHNVTVFLVGLIAGLVLSSVLGGVGMLARTLRSRDRDKGYRAAMLAILEFAHFRQRQHAEQPSVRESLSMSRRLARHDSFVMLLVAADMIGLLVEGDADHEDDDEDGGVDEVDEVRWAMIRERAEAELQTMEQQDEAERAQVPWWRRWMK